LDLERRLPKHSPKCMR